MESILVFTVPVLVLVGAVIWLVARRQSTRRSTAPGIPSTETAVAAKQASTLPVTPPMDPVAGEHGTQADAAPLGTGASTADVPPRQNNGNRDWAADDRTEWETQWSDADGTPTGPPSRRREAAAGHHQPNLPDGGAAIPAGHLSAGQPYGVGSASAGTDGGVPEGYAVKGDAAAMVYYEETDSGYRDAVSNVWFMSPAHAEAAGFRKLRRPRS